MFPEGQQHLLQSRVQRLVSNISLLDSNACCNAAMPKRLVSEITARAIGLLV